MSSRTFLAAMCAAALVVCATASPVYPCGQWVLYKQCGESWSNAPLGTSTSETVCDAGCAMSSVAMSLATYHERVGGQTADPGTLNAWLTSNGGYVDTDLIVWNSVASLGELRMAEAVPSVSTAGIRKATEMCQPVIANVRDGTHWVLITGYDTDNEDLFYVNDPGFDDQAYSYSGMSNFVVYTNATLAAASASLTQHQAHSASLRRAARQRAEEAAANWRAGTPRALSGGKYGVDVSQPTSESAFRCMKDEHAVSFVIIRSYTELGGSDPSVVGTAKAAKAAGLNVGVYHFPDTHKDAKKQVNDDISYLKSHGVDFHEFWVDVERSDWGSNHSWNTHFIKNCCDAAKGSAIHVGVYTSESQWQPITGNSHELHDYDLWWATYNGEPNFDGFRSFGGWNKPYMHQYLGSQDLCGASVDVNWKAK